MQGIISTDEAGAERKEATMTLGWKTKRGDEMMEVQGHLRKLGLRGLVWQLPPEQPPEAEAEARASLTSPIPLPFSPTSAFHWAHHPHIAWETHLRAGFSMTQSRGSV